MGSQGVNAGKERVKAAVLLEGELSCSSGEAGTGVGF